MSLAPEPAITVGPANATSSNSPVHRKPFWRFSLASLLLITALGVTIESHINTSRSLHQLRRESYGLEVGSLDRIHVRKLPQASASVWQWKAHLPETKRLRLNVATSAVTGFPRPDAQDVIEFAGEVTINVIQHKTDTNLNSPQCVTVTVKKDNLTRESAVVRLPSGGGGVGWTNRVAGVDLTESFTSGEPVVLLRSTGLVIWIDEVPPVAPGWKRVENPYFSFEIPRGMTKVPFVAEDTFMESYVTKGTELDFDYGMYAAKPYGWANSATHSNLTIDGRVAQIVTAKHQRRVGFPLTMQLYVDVDGTFALSMFVCCQTDEDLQVAQKIFESIDLKPPTPDR